MQVFFIFIFINFLFIFFIFFIYFIFFVFLSFISFLFLFLFIFLFESYNFKFLFSTNKKMPRTGIEPVTRGFSVLCSTNWAIWAKKNCGGRIWTYDLRVMSPTSFQTAPPRDMKFMDGEGFEPSKSSTTDLQSAPFGRSGIHPKSRRSDLNR